MEQVMLDMIPTGAKAVCHVSQYDIGRTIRFNLRSGGTVYTLSGTETVKVYIKKPDGTTAERNIANTSSTYVDWVTGEGDCDQAGKCECELIITAGTTVIGSKNFIMNVEEDPYNDQGVVTETAGPAIIATFTTNVVDLLQEVKCEINAKQDLHGYDHPWPAGGGVNLFDISNINDTHGSNTLSINGDEITMTWVNGATVFTTKDKQIFKAGNYIVKGFGTNTNKVRAYFYKASDNTQLSSSYLNLGTVNTLTDDFYIAIGGKYDDLDTATFKLQLESGSTAHDYHPYENVCPIEGFTELNIQRNGLNFANIKPYSQWNVLSSDYALSGSIFPTNQRLKMVLFDKDTSVDVSGCYFGFCSSDYSSGTITNKQYRWVLLNGEIMPNKENYPTIGDQTIFLDGLFINPKNEATYNKVFSRFNVMVVLDSETPTEYKPYNGTPYTISIGQEVFGGQLIILPDRTYFHATHGGVSATASDLISGPVHTANNGWAFTISNKEAKYKRLGTAISNINAPTYYDQATSSGFCFAISQLKPLFFLADSVTGLDASSTSEQIQSAFETFCNNCNPFAVYELATPFDIDLTPQQIEALLGINNVWHDGNGNTEVKYLYNA